MARLSVLAIASVPLLVLGCGGAENASVFDNPPATLEDSAVDSATEDVPPAADTGAPVEEDAPPTPVDSGVTPGDTAAPSDTGTPPVDVGPDVPVTGCTEPQAKTFGGHCYFPINVRNWTTARDFCVSRGAHLVTITSGEEQAFVATIQPGEERWIGLSKAPTAPAVPASYRWVTMETGSYTNWFTGEPNGSGNCARLRNDARWADQDCNQTLLGVCERE